MNHQRDEKSHDEALSALYRTTREIEPPDWLDKKILTAAHTAVNPPTPKISPPWRRRGLRFWATPVALAATLVMAIGLVRLMDETGEWQPSTEMDKPAQTLAEPAASEADAAPADQRASPPARESLSLPPAPVSEKAAAPATPMLRMSPPSSVAPSVQERKLPRERSRIQDSFQTAPTLRDEEIRGLRQENERSPTEWLAEIIELRRQGRTAEAEASLAEFRRRYPDYPEPILEEID